MPICSFKAILIPVIFPSCLTGCEKVPSKWDSMVRDRGQHLQSKFCSGEANMSLQQSEVFKLRG